MFVCNKFSFCATLFQIVLSTDPAHIPNACISRAMTNNRRTLKYLQFLTGSKEISRSSISFNKLNFESSINDLRDCDSDPDCGSSNLMFDLIRQEDERGGRSLKKFTHKMKRLTNSSRNIFNEKYTSFMRKIDENSRSSSSGSRSLSSANYFSSKGQSSYSESNSMLDICKNQEVGPKSSLQYANRTLKRTIHPIVRSVSDDSAMKKSQTTASRISFDVQVLDENIAESTQSTPNMCMSKKCYYLGEQQCFCKKNLEVFPENVALQPPNINNVNSETETVLSSLEETKKQVGHFSHILVS